jgi:hypothetical protein
MGKNNKGSNAKRTPLSNHCSTGESHTTNQRYKKHAWNVQFKRLDIEFNKGYFTMKTVSVKTGIDRANICRFVSKYRKENRIYLEEFVFTTIEPEDTGSNLDNIANLKKIKKHI